jgi:triacylglycerol lipase
VTEPTSDPFVPEGLVDSLLTQDLPLPDVPLPSSITGSSFAPTGHPARHDDRWWGHHLAETRWTAELTRLLVSPVWYGRGVPRGDGGPVVLVPGFLAGDTSLMVMANWLSRMGHRPYGSGMQLNVDCSDRSVDRMEKRLEKVVAQNGGRRAALVGHSRGGHFSKALGARRPDLVSQVISMGSGLDEPFDISVPTKAAVAGVRQVLQSTSRTARARGCLTDTCDCPFVRDYSKPFPADEVPLTSIWSKGDGVVRWRACAVPYARNVEVSGSHIGLAFNRRVYRVLGLLLTGHEDQVRTAPAPAR